MLSLEVPILQLYVLVITFLLMTLQIIQMILFHKKLYLPNEVYYKRIIAMKSNSYYNVFDPHEIKLITAILETSNNEGLDINKINSLLNLTKLSSENQRQRRHIILKELNLKLFLITGIRESISRIPSLSDKRIKFYNFVTDNSDNERIKEFVKSYS